MRLYEFSPITKEKAGDFAVQEGSSRFRERARRFADLLQDARVRNALSVSDGREIVALARDFKSDLFMPGVAGRGASVREVLSWYVTPLRQNVIHAAQLAERDLTTDYGRVWAGIVAEQERALSEDGEIFVLCLESVLREVLMNAFRNARHAFGLPQPHEKNFTDRVALVVEPNWSSEDESSEERPDKVSYVGIRIATRGRRFDPRDQQDGSSTVARHAGDMAAYGGEMRYDLLEDDGKAVGMALTLKFVSRSHVRARMNREKRP